MCSSAAAVFCRRTGGGTCCWGAGCGLGCAAPPFPSGTTGGFAGGTTASLGAVPGFMRPAVDCFTNHPIESPAILTPTGSPRRLCSTNHPIESPAIPSMTTMLMRPTILSSLKPVRDRRTVVRIMTGRSSLKGGITVGTTGGTGTSGGDIAASGCWRYCAALFSISILAAAIR